MAEVSVIQLAVCGLVLALLLCVGVWLLFVGLRARREAADTLAENVRLSALLRSSPAISVIVRADGRIDAPEQLAGWLGLGASPRYLADLSGALNGGLAPHDAEALAADIAAAKSAGRPFSRSVHAVGSARALMIRGAKAGDGLQAPGGVVLWLFDATDSQAEIERLADELLGAHRAFEVLTSLIQAAPMPMWYRAPDLSLAMVNSHYADAVDATDPEDVVERGLELIEGSSIGGPLAGALEARDTGRVRVAAVPATIKGERRMLRVYDVPMPDRGVAGFAVDIEDLEQARASIKRFGDTQRAILDRLSAGVAQFNADRALTFCNQPFQRIFALKHDWIADRPEFDRVLERMRDTNRLPEVRDFPGWKAERRAWFVATGDAIEEQWHLPGGAHLRVVAQPLPDGGLLLIFEDRTEQVQLASGLDTLLRVRAATFENLFEALGVFSADGRLQIWNNKFRTLWGLDEAFLATHPRVDMLAKAAAPRLARPERSELIGELVRFATVDRQQRGGRVGFADGRHFEFAAVPLPDGNGLFTMLDISDSRRIEQALRDRNEALETADQIKTSFVANMSYELRTPLTSISGFAEMMSAGYAGKLTESASSYVDAILESVDRLGTLVDEVLDLTQNDGVAPEIERHPVDLGALAKAATETIAVLIRKRALEFAVEIAPTAGSVSGDAKRLRQVVEYLLRHAIAGTQEKGRVLLHLDGTDTSARIVVSDDGAGMSAEAVEHAFDRFAQPGVTRDGERALGLGLPLAKQFVEAHGGTIELFSEPGEGTAIAVTLPRAS
ncbi:sensor histidine kinase [Sphingomonas immobilis]|uniref:histidine kinase n=1 Tax=Sphingomonas immobilis TaxID=3063997 RepID=A0ABT8ZYX7_9SPHN|nr:PAS domain-containing sensor histidine kinase [Sphingomonas sp. CA1-15]MDO7842776.1 PAS-domain containing protein [Sphingomonas sp. CA1-15]